MRNFALKCFGVGDGWPSAERGHSSYLYRFKDAAFLVDCGEPISRSYKASGLSYDLVDHLFLSHLHFDHAGGFFMLMQSFWLERRSKALAVHAPVDALAPLRGTLQAGCIFDELLSFQLQFQPLNPAYPIHVRNVRVTPFATSHLDHLRKAFQSKYPQVFAAFCFLMECGDLRIAHSADIGAIEDLLPLVQQPLDLLVCELAHVPPEALFRFLRTRDIERIAFVHLSRECRLNLEKVQAQAREMLAPVPVAFPEDGDELAL